MAADYLLKIEGVTGESKADGHKGEIEVESFSWGLTQQGTFAAGGGGGAGKSSFQDIHFTTKVNAASSVIALHCASGKHFKTATLTVRKAGETQQEFYIVTFKDCLVSSYQSGGSSGSDSVPIDQFSLNYAEIKFDYKEQKEDGGLKGPVTFNYNVAASKTQ